MKESEEYEPMKNDADLFIDCKHGHQNGAHCRCDEGWQTVSRATANGGMEMDWCSKKVITLFVEIFARNTTPGFICKFSRTSSAQIKIKNRAELFLRTF